MMSKKKKFIIDIMFVVIIFTLLYLVFRNKIELTLLSISQLINATLYISIPFIIIFHIKTNNYFMKNLYDMIENGQYEKALQYIDKSIKGNAKKLWLKIERVNLLAFSGKIDEYNACYNELSKIQETKKCRNNYRFVLIRQMVDFIMMNSYNEINNDIINSKNWKKNINQSFNNIYYSILMYNQGKYDRAIYYASLLNNDKIEFIRYFCNVLQYRAYEKLQDNNNLAKLYYSEVINSYLNRYHSRNHNNA